MASFDYYQIPICSNSWDSFDFSDQDLDNDDIQDIVDQENNDFQDLDDNHHGEEYQSMGLTSGRLPGEILDDLDVKGGADGDISMIDNKMMDIVCLLNFDTQLLFQQAS